MPVAYDFWSPTLWAYAGLQFLVHLGGGLWLLLAEERERRESVSLLGCCSVEQRALRQPIGDRRCERKSQTFSILSPCELGVDGCHSMYSPILINTRSRWFAHLLPQETLFWCGSNPSWTREQDHGAVLKILVQRIGDGAPTSALWGVLIRWQVWDPRRTIVPPRDGGRVGQRPRHWGPHRLGTTGTEKLQSKRG